MIIIGLGNPGKEYHETHHNVGYMMVDAIAKSYHATFKLEKKFQAAVATIMVNGENHYLIKPITYMNLSGLAAKAFMDYYKIEMNKLVVISDDLDLPLATLRIRKNGGTGGHKGLASIIKELGSQDFIRMRIGIGRKNGEVVDFVLSKFSKQEKQELEDVLTKAPLIFQDLIEKGIDYVMNNYNKK